ncbi:sensor histidine kinase [Epilithonimonas hungarica]|uniref:histidine kinase n=1 Tax=Epilithonimonas hungarica TaxID=454006 RepID=A0A1G7VG63_9FLAO|nr:HAMP domain-containing sensor histidine kinase [Epilithonimonas hungarica]MDP9957797.1 nitrogen fixation/metabolism regulation signal transduction histidine kinase [Epilithonimonas hungarica]MPT30194.1 HAMP domain-containing histidine kinase [Chryseobacterium sp.]SDG58558.1 HAMP domain-containing protein [Epilithonimonas hungarica]
MSFSDYKGYRLRNRVFVGFLAICFLSILTSAVLSFVILRDNAKKQSKTDMQNKSEALMSSLDYALSHVQVETKDIPTVLENKIYEIADINKHDIIIYDLNGNYLLSNKEPNLVAQKKMPADVITAIKKNGKQYDDKSYDEKLEATIVSSYMVLKNNMLENIAYVYFPYYHNESAYMMVFKHYFAYIIGINLLIVLFSIWLSWIISNNLTKAITRFTSMISRINLFDKNLQPIKYYKNDELNALVKAYNKMISEIADQRERLSYIEKQSAWQEMAKQVAHEVKNPLTPMKLMMQNFERKFDPNDPNITAKVKNLSEVVIGQIDVISRVASAFSEFAQLPKKNDEEISLNKEIKNVLTIFSDENIFVHANHDNIMMKIDKDYMARIITNLVTNASQAKADDRRSVINVDLEKIEKRIRITVQDNGVGISDDKINKIFDPNFTSKNSGMGIGLTMVKRMVEDYNGTITVVSEVDKGATFTISMPSNL